MVAVRPNAANATIRIGTIDNTEKYVIAAANWMPNRPRNRCTARTPWATNGHARTASTTFTVRTPR